MIILGDCFEKLPDIDSKSVDLILVDPPYNISRNSNFSIHSDKTSKELITKYSKISIDFGEWDKSELNLDFLFYHYYRILKDGGTLIFFYDIWKSSDVKDFAEKNKFKQPRVCQWNKTNPVPVNSKKNYLSNSTEFFFTFVKGKNPTFNSEYDNGVYNFPICHGKERKNHPTQKPLSLIKQLVSKHSNPGNLVLDNFGGSGTTAVACKLLGREFIIMEKEKQYIDLIKLRLSEIEQLHN